MIELLALWPLVHFLVICTFSYKYNRLYLLKELYAIIYLDWIFVPFNFLIPLGVIFSWKIFLLAIIITSISSIILNYKWKNIKQKPKETKYFIDNKGFTPEGITHLIFMSIQSAIVVTVFVSKAISTYYILLLALLMLYLIAHIIIVLTIRKVRLRSKAESPLIVIGISLIIIRIAIMYLFQY